MQIVDRSTGEVVKYEPGSKVEQDFIEDCVDSVVRHVDFQFSASSDAFVDACVKAIVARGVGIARTTEHVAEDVRNGIREVIVNMGFGSEIKTANDVLSDRIRNGVVGSILTLKRKILK